MKSKKLLLVLASTMLLATSCFGNSASSLSPASSSNPASSGDVPSSSSDVAPSSSDSSVAPSSSSSSAPSSSSSSSSSSQLPPEPVAEPANGAFTYAKVSNADKVEIIGALEKWAVENHIAGITVAENGGYVMYSPLVEKGAPNYIKGYGFGTLAEGRLTGPLTGEEEAKYQMYYHDYTSSELDNLIYMDSQAGIDDLGYVAGGLYDIVMNRTKTGYRWVGDLARNDEPVAVDPNEEGLSKVYRVPVKTGADLKYSTLTEVDALKGFNNREVALEDYITPYKIYYTKAYGMKRNAEIKDDTKGSLKNGAAYVAASDKGFNEEAWANLGLKSGHNDDLGDYIEFEFNEAYSPFWARYYISSPMFAPVPAAFIEELGKLNTTSEKTNDFDKGLEIWGKFNSDATITPKDTYLSTGPYVCEEWVKGSKHTFKRNVNYVYGPDSQRATTRPSHYNIEGVYLAIILALQTDTEAALKRFEANQLHAVTVPSKRISDYVNDPRTTIVPGQTTSKLNVNSCTRESWIELFGENGTITQTPESKYWKIKPAMSNYNFLDGISYSIDRLTFAASLGRTPSNNYFGSAYYADPEEGIFYNDTEAHAKAVEKSLEGTDGYGFSREKAIASFKLAAEEMIENGDYEVGDKIEFEMSWQAASMEDTWAKPLAKMIKDCFDAAETGLELDIKQWYAGADYMEAYDKMMTGQFDIGIGGIEGNTYDPLNFLEVLKSDNSSTFTLNWGVSTNETVEIEWDGKLWTFDALWECGDHGGYVENGKCVPTFDVKDCAAEFDADGNLVFTGKLLTKSVENFSTQLQSICLFGTSDSSYSDYFELYTTNDGKVGTDPTGKYGAYVDAYWPGATGTWTIGTEKDADGYVELKIVMSKAFVDAFLGFLELYQLDPFTLETEFYSLGFDVYKVVTLFGEVGDPIYHGTPLRLAAFPEVPAPAGGEGGEGGN